MLKNASTLTRAIFSILLTVVFIVLVCMLNSATTVVAYDVALTQMSNTNSSIFSFNLLSAMTQGKNLALLAIYAIVLFFVWKKSKQPKD